MFLFYSIAVEARVFEMGFWCFNRHWGRIFLHRGRQRRKLDGVYFVVINYVISFGDKEKHMIVLLGTEVVFCWVFVSKFCKSLSVELSFGFFVLKEKDEEKR